MKKSIIKTGINSVFSAEKKSISSWDQGKISQFKGFGPFNDSDDMHSSAAKFGGDYSDDGSSSLIKAQGYNQQYHLNTSVDRDQHHQTVSKENNKITEETATNAQATVPGGNVSFADSMSNKSDEEDLLGKNSLRYGKANPTNSPNTKSPGFEEHQRKKTFLEDPLGVL